MKIQKVALLSLVHQTAAFAPTAFTSKANTFRHAAIVDPSMFHDVPHHIDTLSNIFSSISLADADLSAAADSVQAAAPDVADVAAAAAPAVADVAAAAAAPAVTEAAESAIDSGGMAFLAVPVAVSVEFLHSVISGLGVESNSWGLAIIAMTTIIKLVTYPLTAITYESQAKTAAIGPLIKEIQAKYQSNPEVMNQKIAEVYQQNDFNPLAGCLPVFAQIPIFLGLYRAVLGLAKEDKLNEPFLWLPNLEGPVYGADPASASSWLFSSWQNGVPPLGWEDTLAFISIPVILVIIQSISANLMAPKDQEQPAVLKFLPLMLGFFSISVPAALGIYWIANTLISTVLTLQVKASMKPYEPVASSAGAGAATSNAVIDAQPTTFTPTPMREKPSGFGASDWGEDEDAIKPITAIDAEIEEVGEPVQAAAVDSAPKKNKKRGKKKKKKKN